MPVWQLFQLGKFLCLTKMQFSAMNTYFFCNDKSVCSGYPNPTPWQTYHTSLYRFNSFLDYSLIFWAAFLVGLDEESYSNIKSSIQERTEDEYETEDEHLTGSRSMNTTSSINRKNLLSIGNSTTTTMSKQQLSHVDDNDSDTSKFFQRKLWISLIVFCFFFFD